MTKKNLSRFVLLLITFWSKGQQKPNFIFILADDLDWAQTSTYGSTYYYTPNIDRLAKEEMKFTAAYSAAAVCSSSGSSLMTGKSPVRLHLTDFKSGANNFNMPFTQSHWKKFFPLEEITLGMTFKEKGFRTRPFEKWHLSPEKFRPKTLPYSIDKQGFDGYFVIDKLHLKDNPELDPHKSSHIGNTSAGLLHDNARRPFFEFQYCTQFVNG